MQKNSQIVKICFCAVMAALYTGLDYIAVSLSAPFGGTMKLSVSGIVIIIAAIMYGPLWGGAVGFVGAFLGQIITYGFTATTLLWVLPAVVRGIVFGLLFILFKRSLKTYILCIETVISALLVTAVNTLVMYIDAKIYRYPVALFGIALANRIIAAVITSIIFAVLLPLIIKGLKRILLR